MDECKSGAANFDPVTEECVNEAGSYGVNCKVGYIRNTTSGEIVIANSSKKSRSNSFQANATTSTSARRTLRGWRLSKSEVKLLLIEKCLNHRFREAKAAGKVAELGDWRQWMVKPENKSSAYGICWEKATGNPNYWFTSSSNPVPFCRNTVYDPRGQPIFMV